MEMAGFLIQKLFKISKQRQKTIKPIMFFPDGTSGKE